MAKDKRVEILFDDAEYKRLEDEAHTRGRSVGWVVREAVAQYVTGPATDEKRKAVDWIAAQRGPVGSPEEIKRAIEDAQYEDIVKSLETD